MVKSKATRFAAQLEDVSATVEVIRDFVSSPQIEDDPIMVKSPPNPSEQYHVKLRVNLQTLSFFRST